MHASTKHIMWTARLNWHPSSRYGFERIPGGQASMNPPAWLHTDRAEG